MLLHKNHIIYPTNIQLSFLKIKFHRKISMSFIDINRYSIYTICSFTQVYIFANVIGKERNSFVKFTVQRMGQCIPIFLHIFNKRTNLKFLTRL